MTAPQGTLNLIVDMDIEDTARVEYQLHSGSDIVNITNRGLRTNRKAIGHFELQDAGGAIIAASEAVELFPSQAIGMSFLKAVKPLVLK